MINLVFLLDITGSMESELSGVKRTVGELVKTVAANEAYCVMVTIITFTENAQGCFVTTHSFQDGAAASAFVATIKLCVPPGQPSVHANGGDGDENHKAALAELLRLDGSMPTIAFLITDAGPHLVADRATPEATHEVAYLKAQHNITDTDMFHILNKVRVHFHGDLVLNVIKYTKNSDHRMYGAIAKMFHGVLITPVERRAEKLAAGLMRILTRMFASFARQTSSTTSSSADAAADKAALQGFQFYDVQHYELPWTESQVAANALPVVGSTSEMLFALVERATVIVGIKFAKRALTTTSLPEQVELLLVIAKSLTNTIAFNTALDRTTKLVTAIRAAMPDENKGHFKIQVADLPQLLKRGQADDRSDTSAASALEAAVSAITLMGPEETAATSLGGDGDREEIDAFDPQGLLQKVAGLFLGHLAVLQLPTKNGDVDFMDAWSAVITDVSNDVMSARDFLTMIGCDDATRGLSVRANAYNYVQLFADPRDSVGSALLQAASGTQVLDVVTGLLAGAPPGQFSPNMFRGTLAATLCALVSQHEPALSAYQWAIVYKLKHSIQLLLGPKPKAMRSDPEAPLAKLLFQLLRFESSSSSLDTAGTSGRDAFAAPRRFLQEMLAARIQKVAKYHPQRFLTIAEHMVGYDTHVSAIEDVNDVHALDAGIWRFNTTRATARIYASKLSRAFQACAANVLQTLYSSDDSVSSSTSTAKTEVPTLEQVWPTFADDLPKYVLLQKRTARFDLAQYPDATGAAPPLLVWERNRVLETPLSDDSFAMLAMDLLHKKHDAFIRELRTWRQDANAEKRWYQAVQTMKAPFDEFIRKLAQIQSSACTEHKLLLRAFKLVGSNTLPLAEYEMKLQVVITGRVVVLESETVVFNRGNLHPHPDHFVPMTDAFKEKLRTLQRQRHWSVSHTYRPSDTPNRMGFCNSKPSLWASRRSSKAKTFWDCC